MEKDIIVGHEHILSKDNVPPKFLSKAWIQRLVNKYTLPVLLFLDFLIPITKRDIFSRYAAFVKNETKTQKQNLDELKSYYPEGTKFVILTINMNGMGAGKTKQSYEDQLIEVLQMKAAGEPILVYFHLDPTIEGALDMFIKYLPVIDGLKVYTLMGHYPYHPILMEAYRICGIENKPVIFHTSPESPVYYREKDIEKRLEGNLYPLYPVDKKKAKNSDFCRNFTNPLGYEYVLKCNPNVRFDFAHGAGEVEIEKYLNREPSMTYELIQLVKNYEKAYIDISYSFHTTKFHNMLKDLLSIPNLRGKFLYGTDFYMNKTATHTQNSYYKNLIDVIGVENFEQIAIINQKSFQYGNL